jgi:hypothetical protein
VYTIDEQPRQVDLHHGNQPPEVHEETFIIDENSPVGTVVGQVTAWDSDFNHPLAWAIAPGAGTVDPGTGVAEGNVGGAFTIDPATGRITVARADVLDYETIRRFVLTVEATDNGNPPRTGSGQIVVRLRDEPDTPPTVDHVGVGAGPAGDPAQRSQVKNLQVAFSTEVYFDEYDGPALSIVRKDDGQAVDVHVATETVDGRTVATLTFSGAGTTPGGSLADGDYLLTLHGDRVKESLYGQPLDGDGDGSPGGDFHFGASEADAFFRLFGDSDGDRDVDLRDFFALRQSFRHSAGEDEFLWYMESDSDDDETVDLRDFFAFRGQFRKQVDYLDQP